jgi:alpha-tubulin suppressor-like RCC1 family protein
VLASGALACWGDNIHGELGIGTALGFEPLPRTVLCGSDLNTNCPPEAPLLDVAAVALGGDHTCALLGDGQVRCWGDNSKGQLGTGDNTSSTVAVAVAVPDIRQLAAGLFHTCALRKDATVYCWGSDSDGQLGDGSPGDSTTTPQRVCDGDSGTPCLPLSGVIGIAAGPTSTCAVLGDGGAMCWGDDGVGQLGDGRSNVASSRPRTVCAFDAGALCDASSECTQPLRGVVSIDIGVGHACALLETGQVSCWGSGSAGELGDRQLVDNALGYVWQCTATPGVCPAGAAACTDVTADPGFAVRTCNVASIGVAP